MLEVLSTTSTKHNSLNNDLLSTIGQVFDVTHSIGTGELHSRASESGLILLANLHLQILGAAARGVRYILSQIKLAAILSRIRGHYLALDSGASPRAEAAPLLQEQLRASNEGTSSQLETSVSTNNTLETSIQGKDLLLDKDLEQRHP